MFETELKLGKLVVINAAVVADDVFVKAINFYVNKIHPEISRIEPLQSSN
jgi:hypothetical protein